MSSTETNIEKEPFGQFPSPETVLSLDKFIDTSLDKFRSVQEKGEALSGVDRNPITVGEGPILTELNDELLPITDVGTTLGSGLFNAVSYYETKRGDKVVEIALGDHVKPSSHLDLISIRKSYDGARTARFDSLSQQRRSTLKFNQSDTPAYTKEAEMLEGGLGIIFEGLFTGR